MKRPTIMLTTSGTFSGPVLVFVDHIVAVFKADGGTLLRLTGQAESLWVDETPAEVCELIERACRDETPAPPFEIEAPG